MDVRIETSVKIIIIEQIYLYVNEKETALIELRACLNKMDSSKGENEGNIILVNKLDLIYNVVSK